MNLAVVGLVHSECCLPRVATLGERAARERTQKQFPAAEWPSALLQKRSPQLFPKLPHVMSSGNLAIKHA